MRGGPPPGFFGQVGAQEDLTKQALLRPHAVILLKNDPKEPRAGRASTPYEDRVVLETIVVNFCTFIEESCVSALEDVRKNIRLLHNQFQKPN